MSVCWPVDWLVDWSVQRLFTQAGSVALLVCHNFLRWLGKFHFLAPLVFLWVKICNEIHSRVSTHMRKICIMPNSGGRILCGAYLRPKKASKFGKYATFSAAYNPHLWLQWQRKIFRIFRAKSSRT